MWRVTSHRRTAFLSVLLVPALLLSGCGGSDSKSKDKPSAKPADVLPTGDVQVPDSVDLTKAGTDLEFGEPAYVAYSANAKRGSVLSLTVNSVQQGKIADLASYQLDAASKKARPYYVQVAVKNLGTGDLSRLGVPIFAVDSTDALVLPTTFTPSFARCPSTPLPAGFVSGKSISECLVYLVPDGGTLTEMSYRPEQAFQPITWKGTIAPVAVPKAKPSGKPSAKASKNPGKKKANP
jgi:hypothetical protein